MQNDEHNFHCLRKRGQLTIGKYTRTRPFKILKNHDRLVIMSTNVNIKFLQLLNSYESALHESSSRSIGREVQKLFESEINHQHWPNYIEFISIENPRPEKILSKIAFIDQNHSCYLPDWLSAPARQWLDKYFLDYICFNYLTSKSFDLSYPTDLILNEDRFNFFRNIGISHIVSDFFQQFQSSSEIIKIEKIESDLIAQFNQLSRMSDVVCRKNITTLYKPTGEVLKFPTFSNEDLFNTLHTLNKNLLVFQFNPEPKQGDPAVRIKAFRAKKTFHTTSHIELKLTNYNEIEHVRKAKGVEFLNSLLNRFCEVPTTRNGKIEVVIDRANLARDEKTAQKLSHEARHFKRLMVEMNVEIDCFYRRSSNKIIFSSDIPILVHGRPFPEGMIPNKSAA